MTEHGQSNGKLMMAYPLRGAPFEAIGFFDVVALLCFCLTEEPDQFLGLTAVELGLQGESIGEYRFRIDLCQEPGGR
jgi:hypothetical protein